MMIIEPINNIMITVFATYWSTSNVLSFLLGVSLFCLPHLLPVKLYPSTTKLGITYLFTLKTDTNRFLRWFGSWPPREQEYYLMSSIFLHQRWEKCNWRWRRRGVERKGEIFCFPSHVRDRAVRMKLWMQLGAPYSSFSLLLISIVY